MLHETPASDILTPKQLKTQAENTLKIAITRIENTSRTYTYDALIKAITNAKEKEIEIPLAYSEDHLPDIHKKCLLGEIAEQFKDTKGATQQRMYCYNGLKIAIADAKKHGIIVHEPSKEELHILFSEAIAEVIAFKRKLFTDDPSQINYDFYAASVQEATVAGVNLETYKIESPSTLLALLGNNTQDIQTTLLSI